MNVRRLSLVVLSLVAAACDLEVGPGQEIVLDDRGMVQGVEKPNAVLVQPGGSLVVQDADLLGRGGVVTADLGRARIQLGAGIVSNGGRVRVVQGQVSAGNALVLSAPRNAFVTVPLAPALVAIGGSTVEILGGTLISSGQFRANNRVDIGPVDFLPRTVVEVIDSELRIRGGTLRGGEVLPSAREFPRLFESTLAALRSRVEITGGDFVGSGAFTGVVELTSSRSTIRGGRFQLLGLSSASTPEAPLGGMPGCTEIRGGAFDQVFILGNGERLIVFGSSFNLPFGPVQLAPDPLVPTSMVIPGTLKSGEISGTLESGESTTFRLSTLGDPQVSLAPPGSPGCP